MRLEVGKKYETKGGKVYEVVHIIDAKQEIRYPVVAIEIESCDVEAFTLAGVYDISTYSRGAKNLVREHHEETGGKVHEGVRIVDVKQVERYPAGVTSKYVRTYTLCGYTKAQWEHIIEGEFLCEFSGSVPQEAPMVQTPNILIQTLKILIPTEDGYEFMADGGTLWENCSPIREGGIRQPWFGGECPVSDDMMVLVMLRDGSRKYFPASCYDWDHAGEFYDIVEFVHLGEADA